MRIPKLQEAKEKQGFYWRDPAELAVDLRRGVVTSAEVVQRMRQDPVGWIENVFGVRLYEKQKQIINTLYSKKRVAVQAAFSVGKTFLGACVALHYLYSYPSSKVITIAPTWRQVKSLLWREIRRLWERANSRGWGLEGQLKMTELEVAADWVALGFSTQTGDEVAIDRITGFHAENMLVVMDQAGGLSEVWWRGVKTMLASDNAYWLALGNTVIYNCMFRKICQERGQPGLGEWYVEKITAYDSPNVKAKRNLFPGLVTWEWVKDMEALGKDDPMFKVYVLAEFIPDTDLLLIETDALVKAFETYRPLPPKQRGRHAVLGVDVAMGGDDYSVVAGVLRETGQLVALDRTRGNRTRTLVSRVKNVIHKLQQHLSAKVELVVVDAVGVGAGVYDLLVEELDVPVVAFVGSEKAMNRNAFLNKRAEAAWMLRELIKNKRLALKVLKRYVDDYFLIDKQGYDALYEQLQNIPYRRHNDGRIKLPSKEELRSVLGRSPDEFDALVYATYGVGYANVSPITVVDLAKSDEEEDLYQLENELLWEEL